MLRVRAIHVSAVKSLHLTPVEEAAIGADGVEHDRRFMLVDSAGRVATQRQVPVLAQVWSSYDAEADVLELRLPGGGIVREVPAAVDRTSVELWGRDVPASVMNGPFAEAMSALAGRPSLPRLSERISPRWTIRSA